MMSTLLPFIYQPSLLITTFSLITVALLTNGGFSEIRGNNLRYSKFWNVGPQKYTTKLSGKTGMLLVYTPAFLIALASFSLYNQSLRFKLLQSALTIHFLKRLLEVLFVHKYSSPMFLDIAVSFSLNYLFFTTTMIYSQFTTQGLQEPPIDLKYPGVVIFLMGLCGNFYHHYLLSKMRGDQGDKDYKIPKGGLFNLVICPHYLFEILGFIGVSCIAQTLNTFSFTLGSAIVLMGRSHATRKWYLSKFEDFPTNVKALIPFVF